MTQQHVCACLAALAQLLPLALVAEEPSFEVASIKRVLPVEQSRQPIGLFTYPGGRIRATNYTLRLLIHDAFDVEMYQILGGPSWVDTERYAIEAKPPASSPSSKWIPENFKSPPNAEMRLMLQNLLVTRFELIVHRESKPATVYALMVAKGGPKLREPKDRSLQPFVSFGRTGPFIAGALSETLIGQNATLDQLAVRLSETLRQPVQNKTGIPGNFDFLIEYAANDSQMEKAPLLPRAIQDQVGLKLENQRGSIDVLVIDQAKKPSDN